MSVDSWSFCVQQLASFTGNFASTEHVNNRTSRSKLGESNRGTFCLVVRFSDIYDYYGSTRLVNIGEMVVGDVTVKKGYVTSLII